MSVPERVPQNLHFSTFQVLHLQLESTARKHAFPPFLSMRTGSALFQIKFRGAHPIRGASLSGANPLGLNIRSQSYPNAPRALFGEHMILATVEREGHLSAEARVNMNCSISA